MDIAALLVAKLWTVQARISELEEELEAERAARSKVTQKFSVSLYMIYADFNH